MECCICGEQAMRKALIRPGVEVAWCLEHYYVFMDGKARPVKLLDRIITFSIASALYGWFASMLIG